MTTVAKLVGHGVARAIVADSLLMKQQLLIIIRSGRRAPNLAPVDRLLLGFWTLFLSPHHLQRPAVILRPSIFQSINESEERVRERFISRFSESVHEWF